MKVVVLVVFTFGICLVRAELEESDENIGEVNNNNLNNVTTQKSTDGDTHHNNTITNMVLNNTSGLVENSTTEVPNDLLQSDQTSNGIIAQIPLNTSTIGEIGTLETINNTKSSESNSSFNITPEILTNYTQEDGSNGVDFESGKNASIINFSNRPEISTNTTAGVLLLPTNVTFDFSSNNTRDDISPARNVSNNQNISNGDNNNTISTTTSSSENLVINYNNISEVLKNDTLNFVSVTVDGILHNETVVDNNAIIIQSEILTSSEVSTKTMNENTTPFEMISNVTDIKGTDGTENNNTSNKTDAELLNHPENNVNDRFDTTKNNILPSNNITNDTLLNSNSTVLPEISTNRVNYSTTNATPKEIIENTTALNTNTAEGHTTNKIEVPEHFKNYTSSTNIIISNNITNEVTSDDADLFLNNSTNETNVTKVSNVDNSTTASHNVPVIMDGMQNDQSIETERNEIYTTDSNSTYESSGGVNNTTINDTISKEIIEDVYNATTASHNDSVIMDGMQNDESIERERNETHTTVSYSKNETNHIPQVNTNSPNESKVTVPDQEFNSTIKSTTPVNVTVDNDTLVIFTTPEQPGGNNNNTNVTQLPNTMSSYPNVYYVNNTTSHNGTTIIVLPGGQNHTQPPNQPYHPGGGTLLIPAGVRPNSAISINIITNLVVPIALSTTAMYLVR